LKNAKNVVNKLNRKEFADALQKGLGRAYLHATNYGIDDVTDLVLKACLSDQSCDPQSEGSKAEYLFAMFRNTKYLPEFKEKILSSLKTKRNTWDVQLLFEMTLQMAKAGDIDAQKALKEQAFKIANRVGVKNPDKMDDDWLGASEWITFSGINGAIDLARIYGSRLLKNPEDWVPEDEIFPNDEIKNEFKDIFRKNPPEEPELAAYRDYLEARGVFKEHTGPYISRETTRNRRKREIRENISLDYILSHASNKLDKYAPRFSEFGWVATDEELKTVYQHLLNAIDDEVIWHLLRVFSRVPLPGLDNKIFLWAHSKNDQIRWASIHALSNNTDEKIHALARENIHTNKLLGKDSGNIELFINNYEHNDAIEIIFALNRVKPDNDEAHNISWDIIRLSEKYHDPGLVDALLWSYEKTPCSNCRFRIIKQLDSYGKFTGAILNECQFDANEDVADLARKKLAS
jgi:hypothetical protein